ncbi:MAG: ABC transporter substrate-binding protein [Limnochordia bacterium]
MIRNRSIVACLLTICALVSFGVGAAQVTITYGTNNSLRDLTACRAEAEAYMRLHPEIRVEVVGIGSTADRILAAGMGGALPDLFTVKEQYWGMVQRSGFVMDLTERVVKSGLKLSEFVPDHLEDAKLDGRFYGLPCQGYGSEGVELMAYNKDFFDRAGLAYPTDNWTWDEFVEISRKLTRQSGDQVELWGNTVGQPTNRHSIRWFLYAFGAGVLDPLNNQIGIGSPQAIQALQLANDLVAVYRVSPPLAGRGTGPFLAGQTAIFGGGRSDIQAAIEESGYNVGVVMTPRGPNGDRMDFLYPPHMWAVSKETRYPDETWTFLKWLLEDPEPVTIRAQINTYATIPMVSNIRHFERALPGHLRQEWWPAIRRYQPIRRKHDRLGGVEDTVFAKIGAQLKVFYNGEQSLGNAITNIRTEIEPLLREEGLIR